MAYGLSNGVIPEGAVRQYDRLS